MDLAYTPSLEKYSALFQTFSKLDEDDLKSRLQLLKQLNHLPSDSHSKNGIQKRHTTMYDPGNQLFKN